MLKAIIFDFDGVIVDSEPLHFRAFARVAEPLGVTFDYQHYLKHLIGYDDRDAGRIMLAQAAGAGANARPEDYRGDERRIAAFREEKGRVFEQIVREGVPTIPGVVRLIEEAGAQMPIAVCSGATRADIDLILSGIKLNATFKTIVSADDVARSKPDPACYALAVERLARMHPALRLAPGDCLAIEDTAAGIASARGAGLQTLGLLTTSPRSELHRAQRVVENLEGVSVGQLRAWYC